jgi:hypothetical protein
MKELALLKNTFNGWAPFVNLRTPKNQKIIFRFGAQKTIGGPLSPSRSKVNPLFPRESMYMDS